MSHHDDLDERMSESEEGEIEDENSPKYESNYNQENSSNESSEDETLDIKPPPAVLKSKISRKDHKMRSKHRKHDSHRHEHRSVRERSSHTNQSSIRERESSKRKHGDVDNHRRDKPIQSREEEKYIESIRIVKDVREVRLSKDIREYRDERGDTKLKVERDSFDDKKREWREKRLKHIERKREQNGSQPDSSRHTKESVSNGRDLRDKLRDKERLLKERERRLERFRSPPKDVKRVPSSIVINNKEKEHHITPEPEENEEPMVSANEIDNKDTKGETESDTDSKSESDANKDSESDSDSKSEEAASSDSSEDENEESEEKESVDDSSDSSSSSDTDKEEKREEDTKPVKKEVPKPTPTKVEEPVAKIKQIFATYHPAIQGCRSVDEFNGLSRIEEGTYGVVYRATEKATGEVVALKRLKMEKEKEGFPITSLREINTLLKAQHQNIVSVREIVVGSNIDRIYIVMDYVEHDLKSLMKTMTKPFTIAEVKDLIVQLLRAVAHLHDNWILHRDLKPSNLLLSHKGTLKVGDFGLAREYGSPLKSYTPVVVTLWYRAPELLLGAKKYSTAIDMWSVGCIFGELLTLKPLFPGESEMDQLKRVFKELGTPSEKIWPGFNELPLVKKLGFASYPYNRLKHSLPPSLPDTGFDLINRLLTYHPEKRITAEKALTHDFIEKNLELESEVGKKNSIAEAIDRFKQVGTYGEQSVKGGGFSLKF